MVKQTRLEVAPRILVYYRKMLHFLVHYRKMLHFLVHYRKMLHFLDCFTLKIEVLWSFQTSVTL